MPHTPTPEILDTPQKLLDLLDIVVSALVSIIVGLLYTNKKFKQSNYPVLSSTLKLVSPQMPAHLEYVLDNASDQNRAINLCLSISIDKGRKGLFFWKRPCIYYETGYEERKTFKVLESGQNTSGTTAGAVPCLEALVASSFPSVLKKEERLSPGGSLLIDYRAPDGNPLVVSTKVSFQPAMYQARRLSICTRQLLVPRFEPTSKKLEGWSLERIES